MTNTLEHWKPRYSPWIVGLVVTMATFMEVLDSTIVNVSLKHIAGNLSAGVDESTWVLTSYLVSNAIVLPLSGWFSSLIGRKRFYMLCVALFTLSSLFCGLAPTLGSLVFFRILQGVGGGGLQPSEQAILVDTYPPNKRAMGMALYGMAVVTAPILGPTLGGWITDNFSWRWVFFINIPVGILSLMLSQLVVEDPPHLVRRSFRSGLRIDYIGLGLITLGLGALQIMLDKGEREDWLESGLIVACGLIALVALIAAIAHCLRQEDPVVDFRMLKERNFAISTFTMFLLGFVLYGSTMLLPLYLQTLMGYTATLSGLALSPAGLVTMAMMPFVGILIHRVQPRWLVVLGLVAVSGSLWIMGDFSLDMGFSTALKARMVTAFGLAFLFVPINTMAFAFVPRHKINDGTGLLNLARNIGGSVGIAVATTMLARYSQIHQASFARHMTPLNPAFQNLTDGASRLFSAFGSDPGQASSRAHAVAYGLMGKHAAMMAYIDVFRVMAVLILIALPLMFLMKKIKPGQGAPPVH